MYFNIKLYFALEEKVFLKMWTLLKVMCEKNILFIHKFFLNKKAWDSGDTITWDLARHSFQ